MLLVEIMENEERFPGGSHLQQIGIGPIHHGGPVFNDFSINK
jgi:hypothetical protein